MLGIRVRSVRVTTSVSWLPGSASALPMRLREVTLGALNLLSVTRAPMDEADVNPRRGLR